MGDVWQDLETERDAALERISTLQSDLESQAESLKEANVRTIPLPVLCSERFRFYSFRTVILTGEQSF